MAETTQIVWRRGAETCPALELELKPGATYSVPADVAAAWISQGAAESVTAGRSRTVAPSAPKE